MESFWHKLERPIVGLAAMDGVTDASMREITAIHGHPDFMVTEFTSADGIIRGVTRILRDFYFTKKQRPIVAQIFGANPEAFRKTAIICCYLGFDGIDLNMGCPAESVTQKGGGAALINTPKLAQELISAVKQGISEYINGITLESLDLSPEFIALILKRAELNQRGNTRIAPAISVKTRLGYDKPVIHEWIGNLLEMDLDVITLHGRTLNQHYGGQANWEKIAEAAQMVHQTKTLIFGNGDLQTHAQIYEQIKKYGVDGAWIGRAAMGNPWIFTGHEPSKEERFAVALEHAHIFEEFNRTVYSDDPLPFLNMRKHLGWYIKGFPDASTLRLKLFQTNNSEEVAWILSEL